MGAVPFTAVDFIVIAIVFISTLYGFVRGFTRELLTVGGWILAAFITLYSLPHIKPIARQFIGHEFFADIAAVVLIFLLSLIICSLLVKIISDAVHGSILKSLDKTLGMFFGAIRGIFILVFLYAFLVFLWPKASERPAFIMNAKLLPLIKQATLKSVRLIPQSMVHSEFMDSLRDGKALSDDEVLHGLAKPETTVLKKNNDKVDVDTDSEKGIENLFKQG